MFVDGNDGNRIQRIRPTAPFKLYMIVAQKLEDVLLSKFHGGIMQSAILGSWKKLLIYISFVEIFISKGVIISSQIFCDDFIDQITEFEVCHSICVLDWRTTITSYSLMRDKTTNSDKQRPTVKFK